MLGASREDRPDVDDSALFDDMVDIEVADGERRVAWEQFHRVAHFQWTGIVGVEDPVFLIVARNLVVVILDYGLGYANRLRPHLSRCGRTCD